jgi:hypothetical protein
MKFIIVKKSIRNCPDSAIGNILYINDQYGGLNTRCSGNELNLSISGLIVKKMNGILNSDVFITLN